MSRDRMNSVVRSSVPEPIKDSLYYCWKEGILAQVTIGIFDYYLIPYGLLLGATAQQIGLLVAVPHILASVSQFFAVRAVAVAGTRHRVLLWGIGAQAALLLPIPLLPLLSGGGQIVALIALASVYRIFGSLVGPSWGSLVSDYLPEGQRGQYFGWRSRWLGMTAIFGLLLWGGLLSYFNKISPRLGFVVLFAAAAAARCMSLYYIARMVDVPVAKSRDADFTLWMFLRRFRESNFVKFIFYIAGITFATQLAAPYFSVYMLRDLGFDYAGYTAVHLAAGVAGMVSFPAWGRHMDRVGAASVLKSTGFILPLIPLLWLFPRTPFALVLVELFSGFIWSGFNLAATNFIFDAVTPAKRVRCLAYFNLFNGVAIFAGASLGGWLAERLPPLLGYPLLTLFLLSSALRLLADLLLSRHFKEVRASTEKVSSVGLFMSVLGLRAAVGRDLEPEIYPPLRPPREKHPRPAESGPKA